MADPCSVALGMPLPPQTWAPSLDHTIPPHKKTHFFLVWATGYFDHGDLSSRSFDEIEYMCLSTSRQPTIYNLTPDDFKEAVEELPAWYFDSVFIPAHQPQRAWQYKRVVFDREYRKSCLPLMKVMEIACGRTHSFGIAAYWSMQDDDKELGPGLVDKFKWVQEANHFVSDPYSYAHDKCLILIVALHTDAMGYARGDAENIYGCFRIDRSLRTLFFLGVM